MRNGTPYSILAHIFPRWRQLLVLGSLVCATLSFAAAQELRGVWVDAFGSDLNTPAGITNLVNRARAANLNAIFPQVRRRGDAWYRGGLEPVNPSVANGFDPLQDLITKAHDTSGGKQRLEVHAWLVTYNIWNQQNTPPSQPNHPFNRHPEWLTQKYREKSTDPVIHFDGSNYQFDQALPAVQQHTFDVAMDIVRRYDVDGIHFDYIRYSDGDSRGGYQPWGYHPEAVARYQRLKNKTGVPAPSDPTWLQWRREQVTALLRKVYLHVRAEKPHVTVSAALICYDPAPTLSSNSWFSTAAYTRVLQDWRSWLEEGILDLGCPMTYKTSLTSFTNWTQFIAQRQYQRASAIGQGWYLNSPAATFEQIRITRTPWGSQKAAGQIGYSFRSTNNAGVANATFYQALSNATTAKELEPGADPVYPARTPTPAMPWKSDPSLGHVMGFAKTAIAAQPVDGATVVLTGPVTRTLVVDGTGFFGAVGLPPGEYTATLSVPGFAEARQTFPIEGARVTQLDFQLSPPAPRPLEILTFAWNADTRRLTITWAAEPGKRYRISFSSTLDSWQPQVTGLLATSDTMTYELPPLLETIARRYWRVERED